MLSILHGLHRPFSDNKGIIDYFTTYAIQYDQKIALIYKNQSYSFLKLHTLSNQLAHYLKRCGIKKGDRIGIFYERSPELLVSILSVLKVGGVCVILDPSLPIQRLKYIMNDTQIKHCVCGINSGLSKLYTGQIIIIDMEFSFPSEELDKDINIFDNVNSPAFIFYTSGSTDEPKGVVISHAGILNDSLPHIAEPELDIWDSLLMTSPVSSMRITGEIFYPWFAGATVVIYPKENDLDLNQYVDIIKKMNISILFIVPTMLKQILHISGFADCRSLRYIQSLGEYLSNAIINSCLDILPVNIVNVYGQTEAGCCTITYYGDNDKYVNVVGKPVANRNIYILDDNMKIVEKGQLGNICIDGMGISKQYINDLVQTKQKYTEVVINNKKIGPILVTGDVGVIDEKNRLVLLGRSDEIYKISGMKVSFQEIERSILNCNYVNDVIVRNYELEGHFILVAVVNITEKKAVNEKMLRSFLFEYLPQYLIPAKFIFVEHIPILATGKTDLQAIDKIINQLFIAQKNDTFTTTKTEYELLSICKKVFGNEVQGIKTGLTLIENGGDSLIIINFILQVEEMYNIEFSIEDISTKTLRELSAYIDRSLSFNKVDLL